jgi:phosphoribosyl 1,2-cyclic phosphate phosphodiesterase
LKITFLGTGTSQGVPVIGCKCEVCNSLDYRDKRFRSSIHIQANGKSLVVDTGPDFRQQMLRENIDRVDAILFTHAHRDHTAGLDDVRAFNFLQQMDMPVYGTRPTINQIREDFAYAFQPNAYPGLPRITLNEIDEAAFSINGVDILPLPVMHLKLPVLGFRLGNFAYITDANYISESTLERLAAVEVLVLNALQREYHVSHFNLEGAIQMAEIIGAKKTYFTHISHKLGLQATVDRELPENIALAFDGLQLTL